MPSLCHASVRPGSRRSAGAAGGGGEAIWMPCVYLMRCGDGSLYCGWTTDIRRRLAAHEAGSASRYTRSRLPVQLVALIPVADRSAALREEARIKRLPRAAKLQLIGSIGVAPTAAGARVRASWR